jgi:hypothetical protein
LLPWFLEEDISLDGKALGAGEVWRKAVSLDTGFDAVSVVEEVGADVLAPVPDERNAPSLDILPFQSLLVTLSYDLEAMGLVSKPPNCPSPFEPEMSLSACARRIDSPNTGNHESRKDGRTHRAFTGMKTKRELADNHFRI